MSIHQYVGSSHYGNLLLQATEEIIRAAVELGVDPGALEALAASRLSGEARPLVREVVGRHGGCSQRRM